MSVDCISWAFKMEIPPTERFVLVAICDRADKRQGRFIAWPSYRDISERTGYHASTVKRAVSQLMEWGLIESEKRTAATGRPRSNLYTLHIDRAAPQEVASSSRAALQPSAASSEKPEKTGTSTTPSVDVSRSATIKPAPDRSRTATPDGRAVRPPCMNRQSETESPEEKPKIPEGPEAVRDRYERAKSAWQRQNVVFALGDETGNWKAFRKLTPTDQTGLVASIDNFLKGKKAEWRRWSEASKSERSSRKPKVPPLREVCAFELWKLAGIPSEPGPAAKIESRNIDLCRAITGNSKLGKVWVETSSQAWHAWNSFFRVHGQRLQMRKASIADQMDVGARNGSEGWRFPSEYPPAAEPSHADPPTRSPMRAETDEMADFH